MKRLLVLVVVALLHTPTLAEQPKVQPKVIVLDLFGTVFNFDDVPQSQKQAYVKQVRDDVWSPLTFPESWRMIPAHDDAAEAIERLRRKYTVVTLSNGPVELISDMSKRNGISWDMIVPIELHRVYKPAMRAYFTVTDMFNVPRKQVLLITANPGSGDVNAASSLGWQTRVIRAGIHPITLKDVADEFCSDE